VDACLYHLQGETDLVTPPELLTLLEAFYRETLDLIQARQVNARSVTEYSANNAYQQVLGRQDVHLQWLADAMMSLGGAVPSPGQSQENAVTAPDANERALLESDARSQGAFIDRWAPRVGAISNARHHKLLQLILGEMKEHLRVLQQAQQGRTDLLGRHSDGKVLRGEVMATRPRN
jgi:hypothetical protein